VRMSFGISNQGSTCYLNAAMQVLGACKLQWSNATGETGRAIARFYKKKSGGGKTTAADADLVNNLESALGKLRTASDAGLFLEQLLFKIAEENDYKIIEDLEFSSTAVKVQHVCEYCRSSSEIPGKRGYYRVVHGSESILDNMKSIWHRKRSFPCATCPPGVKRSYEEVFVSKLPRLLNLRVADGGVPMEIPLELSLSETHRYKLLAGCIHSGFHYTAVIRRQNEWLHCNDSYVQKISQYQALSDLGRGKGLVIIYENISSSADNVPMDDDVICTTVQPTPDLLNKPSLGAPVPHANPLESTIHRLIEQVKQFDQRLTRIETFLGISQ